LAAGSACTYAADPQKRLDPNEKTLIVHGQLTMATWPVPGISEEYLTQRTRSRRIKKECGAISYHDPAGCHQGWPGQV